jgi:hypothetical protein
LLGVKRTVNIHGVALVIITAQQQFLPVGLNPRKMLANIDVGDIDKNGCQALIGQQALVKRLDKLANTLGRIHIGIGGRGRQRHIHNASHGRLAR